MKAQSRDLWRRSTGPTLNGQNRWNIDKTTWWLSVAQETKCLTSGAIFHTAINDWNLSVKVDLPFKLDISDEEASILERLLHNQIELVLRYYYEDR